MKHSFSFFVLLLLLGSVGCASPGPFVRFATASEAELGSVDERGVVWFEFQPGDDVPLNIAVLGVADSGAKGLRLVAKKRFFIVLRNGAPPALSFDGETIHAEGSETFLAFGRDEGENSITVLTYVGTREDMPVELVEMTK